MTVEHPASVADYLRHAFPAAKTTTLREMLSAGRVLVNGKTAKSLKQPLQPADRVEVAPHRPRRVVLPGGLVVIHADSDILVVEKPTGLLTATTAEETRETALGLLQAHAAAQRPNASVMLVHRLDRDASGLLVFACSQQAFQSLKSQFRVHSVRRAYNVVVHGNVPADEGVLSHFLAEDVRHNVFATDSTRGKPARLQYRVVARGKDRTRLLCLLETGRKHQVRVQWQVSGHPVCGDRRYGTAAAKENREAPFRLALHACNLAFDHPRTGKRVEFSSPPPAAFNGLT